MGSVRGLQRSSTGCDFGFKGCILNALNVTTFDAAHLPDPPPLLLLLLPPPSPGTTLNDCRDCVCVCVCGEKSKTCGENYKVEQKI